MLLLNWIFYSLPHTNKTQFSANLIVNEHLASVLGLDTVHNQLSSLVSRVQGYGIDSEEFLCLKAIGLLNAGESTDGVVSSFVCLLLCVGGSELSAWLCFVFWVCPPPQEIQWC